MPWLPLQPVHGRSLDVRTSGAHSRCNRNRQPRASNAHPYTALCARRCRLITQFESQTSCAPCHSSCTNPCARFGNNQRVSDNNWQRMCRPTLVDQSTTHRHAARTIAVYIHRPTRTTEVRTARACRGTSLCNLRVHSFPAIAGTPNRNEQLSMYKNCVIIAAYNASQ